MTTAPPAVVINIDSVTCACCGTRWWPEGGAPSFPENFVCDVCEQWFALFQIPGEFPIFGPARVMRRALAGQQITREEWVTDASPFVVVCPIPAIRTMINNLLEARS